MILNVIISYGFRCEEVGVTLRSQTHCLAHLVVVRLYINHAHVYLLVHHSSDIINNITPQSLCIHKKNCYFSLDSCQFIHLCSSLLSYNVIVISRKRLQVIFLYRTLQDSLQLNLMNQAEILVNYVWTIIQAVYNYQRFIVLLSRTGYMWLCIFYQQ